MDKLIGKPYDIAVPVYLSTEKICAAETAMILPEGSRMATLKEVTLLYRHDENFADFLCRSNWVWHHKEGLKATDIRGYWEMVPMKE